MLENDSSNINYCIECVKNSLGPKTGFLCPTGPITKFNILNLITNVREKVLGLEREFLVR